MMKLNKVLVKLYWTALINFATGMVTMKGVWRRDQKSEMFLFYCIGKLWPCAYSRMLLASIYILIYYVNVLNSVCNQYKMYVCRLSAASIKCLVTGVESEPE